MTELRLTVPDARCVSCRKVAPTTVRNIHQDGQGSIADLALPEGWITLTTNTYNIERVPYSNFQGAKSFAICATCHQALPGLNSQPVTVTVERGAEAST